MTLLPPKLASSPGLPAKRTRTRAALVDAALTLIAERGSEIASIDELVRQAGMARGTFYNYFLTWNDLLVAVAERMDAEYVLRIDSRLDPEASAPVTLACMLRGMIQISIDEPRLGWVWVRLGPRVPALLEDRPVTETRSKQALRSLSSRHASDAASFCLFGGTIFATSRRLLEKELPLEEVDSVIGMLLRGVGVAEAEIGPALAAARAFVTTRADRAPDRHAPA